MIYHSVNSGDDDFIWKLILSHAGEQFHTARGLPFTYHQKISRTGKPLGELVIDRREKTITRNTVLLAYRNAMDLMETEGCVNGPKKLGVFGASYLYPVFLETGVCGREQLMENCNFYGSDNAALKDIHPITDQCADIHNPYNLYAALLHIWSADTCAPRMRSEWTADNPTLGQCSITAFLTQDIFGGRVYGILRPDGNYHCYNVVDGVAFDLTSEQFGNEQLDYTDNPEQFREIHFQKTEKKERYKLLKERLMQYLSERNKERC